jgi:NADH:ubiquinone oxidoreductase subunit 6 (subunit J)
MFMEIMIFIAAVFMLTLAGIQLLTSRGREEKLKEAKNKILYTVLALVFVGIINVWERVAFNGIVQEGVNLFGSLANLALFFAAPVAIFFLSLASYYLITANGDEEQLKKAKNIVINTLLATLILLAAYTFLLELGTL